MSWQAMNIYGGNLCICMLLSEIRQPKKVAYCYDFIYNILEKPQLWKW